MTKIQQQLSGKLESTPTDTSLVCSIGRDGLNKEETLSVHPVTLPDNDLEENLHRVQSVRHNMSVCVYVLNMRGKPLMPTTPRRARVLVRESKAKVVKRTPFTIQLKQASGETKQKITLGIDSGYKYVGFSAVTKSKELISGELTLRTDVSKKLQDRAMYRKTRRGRLWHRKPRFDNRTRKEGWLAPSIQHKVDTHLRLVQKIKDILPINNVIVEIANFDQQKMQKPEISGIEYQQGELQGYEVREYLLDKWGRKCAYCNKKGIPLEIEHIVPKSRGGTNRVSNLTLACNKCNLKKGTQTAEEFGYPNIQTKAKESLKATVFMNYVRTRIVDELECEYTYGYITKHNRIKLKIDKSHSNDAFVIAKGTTQQRIVSYVCTQTRRNNRCLQKNRKGLNRAIRRQRYKLQPKDIVSFDNKICLVKGVHCKGTRIIINNSQFKSKSVSIQKVNLIKYGKGILFNIHPSIPLPFKNGSILEASL